MKKLITMAAIATLLGACGFENSRNTNANNGNLRVEANTAFHLKMIGKDLLNEESGASAAEGNLHVVSLSEVPAGVYNADLTPDDPAAFIAMSREITVKFLAGAQAQTLSPRMVAQRNRLLENRLLDLQRRRVDIQAERNEEIRRDLKVEIDQERAKANEAAERMRKEIELSVERNAERNAEPPSAPEP